MIFQYISCWFCYFDYDDHGVQAGCDDFDKLYGFGDHDGNVSLMLMDMFAVGMMVVMLVHCI